MNRAARRTSTPTSSPQATSLTNGAHKAHAGPPDASGPPRQPADVAALELQRQERTLRALLRTAKLTIAQQQEQQQQEPGAGLGDAPLSSRLGDSDLARLNAQLQEACRAPRPDARTLLRVELLLGELRRWLAAAPASPAAAVGLLYGSGEGVAHAEHAVRSAGQVRFWGPEAVGAFVALLRLYSDLLAQASRAAQAQAQQQSQRQQQRQQQAAQGQDAERRVEEDAAVVAAPELAQQQQPLALPSPRQQQQQPSSSAHQLLQPLEPRSEPPRTHPLTFAAAALLLRPEWLDLLAAALQLLHFSDEYGAAAARAGRPPGEALGAALQLWGFLTQLVKFAAAHAEMMEPCLQRLGALLAPPYGALPRLLALPPREDTLAAQLHGLWLLQVLYDMPDSRVLRAAPLADHYVALHHGSMVASYEASAADPNSAAAELCRLHATLLHSLARQPGQHVRAAFVRQRTVQWLLRELSLECTLLPAAAQQQAEAAARAAGGDDDSDGGDSSELSSESSSGSAGSSGSGGRRAGELAQAGSVAGRASAGAGSARGSRRLAVPGAHSSSAAAGVSARSPVGRGGGGGGFAFTYDLNEDVERLMALEDKLGIAATADAASSTSAPAAAAAAAAAAAVYLSALLQIVDALALLAASHVVHFDLKCANVLIEPLPGVRDGQLWAPAVADGGASRGGGGGGVPFRCVLADFGEARAYRSAAEAFTARNRGTEVFKSPEMLMLNAAHRAGGATVSFAPASPSSAAAILPGSVAAPEGGGGAGAAATASRPRSRPPSSRPGSAKPPLPPPSSLAGAGLASDVWSLGCLAYELLSGCVLFSGDYASVTHRVAFGPGERLVLTEAERARLGGLPELVALVEWVLARDPGARPSLAQIRARVEAVRAALLAR
ncbi:putative serine/threonine-protein kinase [Tetrabaena socialis]|uniref:Putative serine/threonine-protein kinase n=1 Tax=Tetrabaena socialis TaxID=47790 RepID=A0A2J7ZWL1_9CHLO|nr:putative serine/threonine-protein kinase [Tetrabaena socialis]|eukprot:PNH04663.1 putative serine/threonine-protein kinase [Tetrabaena socialis]